MSSLNPADYWPDKVAAIRGMNTEQHVRALVPVSEQNLNFTIQCIWSGGGAGMCLKCKTDDESLYVHIVWQNAGFLHILTAYNVWQLLSIKKSCLAFNINSTFQHKFHFIRWHKKSDYGICV